MWCFAKIDCAYVSKPCRALALGALRRHTISPAGMGVAERIRHIRAAARDMEADPPPLPPAAAMAPAQPGAGFSVACRQRSTAVSGYNDCSLLPMSSPANPESTAA